jgi:hypothetical protein
MGNTGLGNNWVLGTYTNLKRNYSFQAKLAGNPGVYAIPHTKVTKLYIRNADTNKVVLFWDEKLIQGTKESLQSKMAVELISRVEDFWYRNVSKRSAVN